MWLCGYVDSDYAVVKGTDPVVKDEHGEYIHEHCAKLSKSNVETNHSAFISQVQDTTPTVLSGQKRVKTDEGELYCGCLCTSVLLYADDSSCQNCAASTTVASQMSRTSVLQGICINIVFQI